MLRTSTRLIRYFTKNKKYQFEVPVYKSDLQSDQPSLKASPQQQKKTPVKLRKIPRKSQASLGVTKVQPQYAHSTQHMSKTQANYHRMIDEKIQQNLKTHRFYDYELERGEDLIDNIPVDPYYQYKLQDLHLEMEAQKQKIQNMKIASVQKQQIQKKLQRVDPQKLQKLKSIVETYQTKKHRYQYQQYLRKLAQYPGSVKGQNPEDDPEVYQQYKNKIMPPSLKAQLNYQSEGRIKFNENEQKQQNLGLTSITELLSSDPRYSNLILKMNLNDNDDDFIQQIVDSVEQAIQVIPYDQVPLLPNIKFEQYHGYLMKQELWQKVRNTYDKYKKKKQYAKLQQVLLQLGQKPRDAKNAQQQQLQPKIYSLFTYYKTLPKQIRQYPAVRTVYLGLQYSSPDVGYHQKVQLLNKAAKMALPLDKFSTHAMQELLRTKKKYLTPHLADRILNMNPQYTWDIFQFLQQVKDQKLRSMSTVKEKQQFFIQPPQYHKMWEEGMANLPVDYYDNDDGFWDEYIDKKLKKYEKVQPISKRPRKHLMH